MYTIIIRALKATLVALCILLNLTVATHAVAATIISSPKEVSLTSGDTFSVRYLLDPQGEKNYTAKLILGFPATTLKVESFQFGGSWIPLSQPGYDMIDAAGGVLIKTAGYPGGLAAPTLFATVQFRIIGSEQGVITVQSNSLVLNAQNQNVLGERPLPTTVTVVTAPLLPNTALQPEEQKPAEEQNLFDVELTAAPVQKSFNWMPWTIIVLAICLAVICGIEARRWYQKRNSSPL